MERITFCASCGEANPFKAVRCAACDAPLRHVRDWRAVLAKIPRPSPLGVLVSAAVLAVLVALGTYVLLR